MRQSSTKDRSAAAALDEVRVVEPTAANAARLWQDYQHFYRGDADLLARVCDSDSGIDGLTEECRSTIC